LFYAGFRAIYFRELYTGVISFIPLFPAFFPQDSRKIPTDLFSSALPYQTEKPVIRDSDIMIVPIRHLPLSPLAHSAAYFPDSAGRKRMLREKANPAGLSVRISNRRGHGAFWYEVAAGFLVFSLRAFRNHCFQQWSTLARKSTDVLSCFQRLPAALNKPPLTAVVLDCAVFQARF
jgi:hypothetical protein